MSIGVATYDRWYEDRVANSKGEKQLQWNWRRRTWTGLFQAAGFAVDDDERARRAGALRPGVFYFGWKTGQAQAR